MYFLDLEYWKVPSRRFYVAKKGEYEDVVKTKARSLNQKKKNIIYAENNQSDEEYPPTITPLIKKVRIIIITQLDISCMAINSHTRLMMTSVNLYENLRLLKSSRKRRLSY